MWTKYSNSNQKRKHMTSKGSNENDSSIIEDGEVFEWRLDRDWGYGWASAGSPEAGLREAAAEAVRLGEIGLQWRGEAEDQLQWMSSSDAGPVPDVRVLGRRQIAELGARHRADPSERRKLNPHRALTEYPKDYIVGAILAGAVPTLSDLQLGLESLRLYMHGLLDGPVLPRNPGICTDPDDFDRHCEIFSDQLCNTAAEYREVVTNRARRVQP